jgi:phosphatidylethanolamine-binding protein (PEBP) family uncharacterized protein
MMRTAFRIAYSPVLAWGLPIACAATLVGCSQDGANGTPSAGGSGTAGSSTTTAGTGGSSATAGTAGADTSAGTGGAAGAACLGDPPVTPNKVCADIPPQKKGDAGFTVTSPDFTSCGEIPKAMTCDGNDFGTGASPKITWTGVPAGTMSFAVVFKDISLSNDVATERFGYHWVMWDIPATTMELPGGMTGGYQSAEVPGAHQWSSLGSYGFFTPCPNPFPREAPMFMCSLTQDSYAITVYALKVAKLTDLPPAIDTGTNMPAATGWNWVVNMGHYIESLDAVAVAEYRGTSKAWAKNFVPPNAAAFPCSTASGAAGSGGAAGGSGAGGSGGASGSGGSAGKGGASGGSSAGGASGSGGANGSSGSGGSSGSSGSGGAAGASGAPAMCLK